MRSSSAATILACSGGGFIPGAAALRRQNVVERGSTTPPFFSRTIIRSVCKLALSVCQAACGVAHDRPSCPLGLRSPLGLLLGKTRQLFKIKPLFCLDSVRCPESNPFAFNHGHHCCAYNSKPTVAPAACGGDATQLLHHNSPLECCLNGAYVPCHGHVCSDRPFGNHNNSFNNIPAHNSIGGEFTFKMKHSSLRLFMDAEVHWTDWGFWDCDPGNNMCHRNRTCPNEKPYLAPVTCFSGSVHGQDAEGRAVVNY